MAKGTPYEILCAAEAAFATKGLYGADFGLIVEDSGVLTPADIQFHFGFRAELYAAAICFRIPEIQKAHSWVESELARKIPVLYSHADCLLLVHAVTGAWAIADLLPNSYSMRMNANMLTLPKPIQLAVMELKTHSVAQATVDSLLRLLGIATNPGQAGYACRQLFQNMLIGLAVLEREACELAQKEGADCEAISQLVFEWTVDLCQRLCLAYIPDFIPLPRKQLTQILKNINVSGLRPNWSASVAMDHNFYADCRKAIADHYNDVPPRAAIGPVVTSDDMRHNILLAAEHLAARYTEHGFELELVASEAQCTIEDIVKHFGDKHGLIVATRLYRMPAHSVFRQKFFELIEQSDEELHARHYLWAVLAPAAWRIPRSPPNTWHSLFLSVNLVQPGTPQSDVLPSTPWEPVLRQIIKDVHMLSDDNESIEVVAMRLRCGAAMGVRSAVAIENEANEMWDNGATYPVIAAMCEQMAVDSLRDCHVMVFGDTVPFDREEAKWLIAEASRRAGKPEWYIGPASEAPIIPMPDLPDQLMPGFRNMTAR